MADDFDPRLVGEALLVLENTLLEELSSDAPDDALLQLKRELASTTQRAHEWAERSGVPTWFVPDTPSPQADLHECLRLLRKLSAALTFLGSRRVPASMSEVTAWLEEQRCTALTELVDLGQTIREVGDALLALESAAREFDIKLGGTPSPLNGGGTTIAALRSKASDVHDAAIVVREVFEELERRLAWIPE